MRPTLRATISSSLVTASVLGAAGGAAATAVASIFIEPTGLPPLVASAAGAAIGAAAAAAVAWPLSAGFARKATAPLDALASAAVTLAAGDHSKRAPAEGPREVRLVAEAFNTMATDVDRAIEQLANEEHRKMQFVSDVSHELRTPLTAIKGAAETLLDGGVDPVDQERFLATIATEAERLTRLANDLLTLQRIEGATGELPLRRIDLRESVDRAAAMLEPLIDARGVVFAVSGTAPAVLGDRDRLQQVVTNLIDNASRIVGEGGHVTVRLSASGGEAVLSVEDDGPGIPAADLPHLFDRFYRSDTSRTRSSGGAGLGLAIVRAIVTAHAGSIEAENVSPTGSRFTVRLPALPD